MSADLVKDISYFDTSFYTEIYLPFLLHQFWKNAFHKIIKRISRFYTSKKLGATSTYSLKKCPMNLGLFV